MEHSSTSHDSNPTIAQKHTAKTDQKFEGFDLLRTIFSIAVVAYKTDIFFIPNILIPGSLTYALSAYVLSGVVGALAVPVFLHISLFLFYLKSEKTGFKYFVQKRLPKLIFLHLFWVSLITIFDIFFLRINTIESIVSSPKRVVEFIVSGHSTPFFFFFSLIFVTIIAQILILFFGKLKKPSTKMNVSYWLLILSSIMVFSFSTIDPIIKYTNIQSPFLNYLNNITLWDYTPFNFIPYVFTAAITAQEYREGKLEKGSKLLGQKLYILLPVTLVLFALEWILTSNKLLVQVDQAPLDHYMRLSLVFGSWFILYLALQAKHKAPAVIRFISDCSLGIYVFHVFLTYEGNIPLDKVTALNSLFQAFPIVRIITVFLFTLAGSIALTLCFKRIKILKQFV